MAETVKKAKTAAKPRKTTSKKAAPEQATADPISLNGDNSQNHRSVPYEEVAQLAHRYWTERGQKHGHHEEDWYRAEQELIGKAS